MHRSMVPAVLLMVVMATVLIAMVMHGDAGTVDGPKQVYGSE